MKTNKTINLIFLVCVLAFLPACGPGNSVRLLAPPVEGQVAPPPPNAPRVTVIRFADKRKDKTVIGQRRDNSAFTTQDNVRTWVSRALADELVRHGMQISYANNTDKAIAADPDFLVLGDINEIWLRETSTTDLSLSMSVNYAVHNRQKRVRREEITTTLSHSGLPSGSAADDLLREGVRELAKDLARKINSVIRASK